APVAASDVWALPGLRAVVGPYTRDIDRIRYRLLAAMSTGGCTLFLTNTETVPGAKITRVLGMVQGNTVRAKHLGKDLLAGFKSMAGGELHQYTELMTEARQEAVNRMVAQA